MSSIWTCPSEDHGCCRRSVVQPVNWLRRFNPTSFTATSSAPLSSCGSPWEKITPYLGFFRCPGRFTLSTSRLEGAKFKPPLVTTTGLVQAPALCGITYGRESTLPGCSSVTMEHQFAPGGAPATCESALGSRITQKWLATSI